MELSDHIAASRLHAVSSRFALIFLPFPSFSHPPPWSEVKMYPLRVSLFPFHSSGLCLHTFLTSFAKFLQRCPAACWLAAGKNNKSRRRFIARSSCFWVKSPGLMWEIGESLPVFLFIFSFFYLNQKFWHAKGTFFLFSVLSHQSVPVKDLKLREYFNICESYFFPFVEQKLWRCESLNFTAFPSSPAHSLHTAVTFSLGFTPI